MIPRPGRAPPLLAFMLCSCHAQTPGVGAREERERTTPPAHAIVVTDALVASTRPTDPPRPPTTASSDGPACVTPTAPANWSRGADGNNPPEGGPTRTPGGEPTQTDLDGDGTPDLFITANQDCDIHTNCLWNVYTMHGACGILRGQVAGETIEAQATRHEGMADLVAASESRTVWTERRYRMEHGRYALREIRRLESNSTPWRPARSEDE